MAIAEIETHHLVTIPLPEAGKLLGISRSRCYELNGAGEFPVPVRRIAGSWRVRVVDVETYLNDQFATN